jgi:simple sugar transport system ATP-binding protein
MTGQPIVSLENVTKTYGGIAALANATFDLLPGEIHALVGENGAGKSTLCKIIAGVVMPSDGTLKVDGEAVAFSMPKDASRRGIAMVYQETSLVPQLTVAQNIVLGRERTFNSVRQVRSAARQVLQRLNFKVDPSQLAGTLSAAKRQMVEIARAVLNQARVIIFDEPTAALTPEETDHLFDLMRSLKRSGVSMIFISHALEEALEHADRITVLRNGFVMTTGPAPGFDRNALIQHMIGDELKETGAVRSFVRAAKSARPVLRVENVRMGSMVNNMSFSIFPGEITGIAGLIGSGRSEIAKVIMGHTKRNFGGGRIWLDGREVRYRLPAQAVADGIAYVSEDRKLEGFFETMSASDNIGLGWLARFGRGLVVAPRQKMRQLAEEWESRLSIRAAGAPAFRRQPAEGRHRQVAGPAAQAGHLRRADARRRCRRHRRDPAHHPHLRRERRGRHPHLLLPAGNPRTVGSHPRGEKRHDRRRVLAPGRQRRADPPRRDPLNVSGRMTA